MYVGARRVFTGAWTTNKWLSVLNETSFLPPVAISCLLMAPRGTVASPPHTTEYDGANLVWFYENFRKDISRKQSFTALLVNHSCPRSCSSERPLRSPKRQTPVVARGCSSEMNDWTLLLKTLQTLVKEHREIQLELTWKILPSWLAFIVPERVFAKCRGEKSSMA